MEKNIYTNTGQTLKILGIIIGILVFLFNAFDFSPDRINEMFIAVFGGFLGGFVVFVVLFFIGKYLYNLGTTKTNLPLKHIKEWPKSLKTSGVVSLIIITLDLIFFFIVFTPCFVSRCRWEALGESLVGIFILLPIFVVALLLWAVPFAYYFIKQK